MPHIDIQHESYQYARALSYEPSLMAFAPTSLP